MALLVDFGDIYMLQSVSWWGWRSQSQMYSSSVVCRWQPSLNACFVWIRQKSG